MDGWYGVVGDWVGFTITINKNDHYLYRIAPYHVVVADIHLRYVCGVRVGEEEEEEEEENDMSPFFPKVPHWIDDVWICCAPLGVV